MAYRKSESSAHVKRAKKKEPRIKNEEIDFSDIPELSNEQLKKMKRVGRPPLGKNSKHLVAIRLEPGLIESLRLLADKSGIGYQTLIHDVLEKYVGKKAA